MITGGNMKLHDVFEIKQDLNSDILKEKFNAFIIYGAGNVGKDIWKILKEKKYSILCFIDINAKENETYNGTQVITPEKAASLEKEKVCVIIGMMNRDYDIKGIADKLVKIGFNNIINFYEFYHIFPRELGERYFLQTKDLFNKNKSDIIHGLNIWEDEKSKNIYEQTIIFRYTGNLQYSPTPDNFENQYLPDDVPGWDCPSNLIDCGAYDGDTLKAFFKNYGKINSIVAFEPDIANFDKLKKTKDKLDLANEVILYPCGVYSETKQLRFSASREGASYIDTKGDTIIQTVSLDDALTGYRPGLIKMDIEGAELEALKGAELMIKKYIPKMAICLYHRPDDIWQIPDLIKSWNLGYRFYLRAYGFHSFDLVLLAIK